MELILTERSDGSYGAPALHGILTASVVGPKPVPMDWILQTVLSPPESEAIGFDDFPEFTWVVEKIEEWLFRIGRVFQQDPEMFRLLVYMPKLKEGDTTPDPQTWCNGFVEAMALPCQRELDRPEHKRTMMFAATSTNPSIPPKQRRMVLIALSADASASFAGTLTIWAPITSLSFQPKPLAVP